MKLSILTFLSLMPFMAYAQEVSFSYGKTNELILTAKSCDVLKSEAESLCQWKEEVDEVRSSIPSCRRNANGTYSLTVTQCLPQFAKTYHHQKHINSGANCWGTAMSFKKLSSKPRFVWPEEMEYWMDSPVCRKLDVGEKLQAGDIINVYGPEYIFEPTTLSDKGVKFWNALYPGRLQASDGREGYSGFHNFLHSETFISQNITFGKDSPSHEDKFDFHHLAEVYGRSRESECQENQALSPHRREYQNRPREIRDSRCGYFTIAYRCGNIAEYFKAQSLTESEQRLITDINSLFQVQEKLFPLMMKIKSLPKNEVESILKLADSKAAEALELLKSPQSKSTEMLLTQKYFTAQSLRKSLEQARLTNPTEPL